MKIIESLFLLSVGSYIAFRTINTYLLHRFFPQTKLRQALM